MGDNPDAFPTDHNRMKDNNKDGVSDEEDTFPNDASETHNSDSDGVGDNADKFPNDAKVTKDSNDDGIGDNADVFPLIPTELLTVTATIMQVLFPQWDNQYSACVMTALGRSQLSLQLWQVCFIFQSQLLKQVFIVVSFCDCSCGCCRLMLMFFPRCPGFSLVLLWQTGHFAG